MSTQSKFQLSKASVSIISHCKGFTFHRAAEIAMSTKLHKTDIFPLIQDILNPTGCMNLIVASKVTGTFLYCADFA